jgi:hypothetical protein
MKIVLKGKIKSLTEHERAGESFVSVHLQPDGNVDTVLGPEAKKAHSDMYLYLKQVAAEKLKFGQELTVTVSTEEP